MALWDVVQDTVAWVVASPVVVGIYGAFLIFELRAKLLERCRAGAAS